jgi:hypothetical protein
MYLSFEIDNGSATESKIHSPGRVGEEKGERFVVMMAGSIMLPTTPLKFPVLSTLTSNPLCAL